jgi:hypothetical protein
MYYANFPLHRTRVHPNKSNHPCQVNHPLLGVHTEFELSWQDQAPDPPSTR